MTEKTEEMGSHLMTEPTAKADPASGAATATESAPLATISDIRRERRARRRMAAAGAGALAPLSVAATDPAGDDAAETDPVSPAPATSPAHRSRRRPRAPQAERLAAAAKPDGQPAAVEAGGPAAGPADAAPLLLLDPDTAERRAAKTATRARRKQQTAADAVANADDNPALGALNRHLNQMMQQLNTAHRVIGRVAAERDALRQQLADVRGIPVEEITVTTIGAATAPAGRPAAPDTPRTPSPLARLNFFGGEDIALMRKRRQMFVMSLIFIAVAVAVAARQLHWSMPADISKNGLAALPFIGQFMTLFLAGWLVYRVVRVSSKGVRWVFPTDDRRRRKR